MEWVKAHYEELRIISQTEWDKVQKTLNQSVLTDRIKPGSRGKFLLSGHLTCGKCGSSMIARTSGKGWVGFVCNASWKRGNAVCGYKHRLSLLTAKSAIIAEVTSLLSSESLVSSVVARSKQKMEKNMSESSTKELVMSKDKIEREITNLLDLAQRGVLTDSVRTRLLQKESDLSVLQEKISLATSRGHETKRITEKDIHQRVAHLRSLLENSVEKKDGTAAKLIAALFPHKLRATVVERGESRDWVLDGNMVIASDLDRDSPPLVKAGEGTRTPDQLITNQLLYQLSYTGLECLRTRSRGDSGDRDTGSGSAASAVFEKAHPNPEHRKGPQLR